jgi:hypothetical protein
MTPLDDTELLDVLMTMVTDLRMDLSQQRERIKRLHMDVKNTSTRGKLDGQITGLTYAYEKVDTIVKDMRQFGLKTAEDKRPPQPPGRG